MVLCSRRRLVVAAVGGDRLASEWVCQEAGGGWMRKNQFPRGSALKAVYLRLPEDLVGRLQAIADRPADGGAPISVNRLCHRLIANFVRAMEGMRNESCADQIVAVGQACQAKEHPGVD